MLQTILLALIQGVTEFLPISSSAHLILVPLITGWPDQGIAFDVAVHVGTLLAVLIYFRQDILKLIQGFLVSLKGESNPPYTLLSWQLILATIPVALIGYLSHDFIASHLRSPFVIAIATIAFGVLLLAGDKLFAHPKRLNQLTLKDALWIGMAQIFALIPGTSRSGITLTAGLALGYNRESSAKFSFLLAIPTIVLAGSFETLKLIHAPQTVNWFSLLLGVVISGSCAYACIHYFLKLINTIGMLPFVLYRLLLGLVLMWFFVFS